MTTPDHLLPPNATPLERAVTRAMDDGLGAPIRQAVDPNATPAAFLPFLAVHDGVRLWFHDWSEARKRQVISESIVANFEVGTRAAVIRYLSYVDATLLDAIAYPKRFVAARAVAGRTPLGHPAFVARYLVKVVTYKPRRAAVAGRAVAGRHAARSPSREPFKRVFAALRAAKAPETQYRVNLQTSRRITVGDAIALDGAHRVGDFIPRTRL
ncbi:MAG TPA: phage tail protein I [Methylocystis sp.]